MQRMQIYMHGTASLMVMPGYAHVTACMHAAMQIFTEYSEPAIYT